MDVVSAFLHADVVSNIYMEQPEGYHVPSSASSRLVCKLDKALYGIREAPRAWNALFNSWLVYFGFSQFSVDPAIFTIISSDFLYVLVVYMDESIIVGRFSPFIAAFKVVLSSHFDIDDLGPASWLLGCSITRGRLNHTLIFSQSQYVHNILEHFGMSTCSPNSTPMAAKLSTDSLLDLPLDVKTFPFASLIGKLLYYANMTRPDISTSVSLLSRFMSSPTCRHWEQAKRILRYVSGTKDYCLTFTGFISPEPLIWQDSSFADDVDRRSRNGFVTMMSGGSVSWSSRLQNNVALFTSKAEYMALTSSSQEAMFLRQLLPTVGLPITGPTATFEDNESCIALATDNMTTSKSKHIDIKYHYIRELVKQGSIRVLWCPTDDMLADSLTKFSLLSSVHLMHARRMLSGTFSGPVPS
jgi:hypothetical protein